MKNMMNTIARVTTIVMIAVALFVTFGVVTQASEKAVGTNERTAEFNAEAFAEKAMAVNNKTVATVEPVVEGATGTAYEVEVVETVIAAPAIATAAQVEEEEVEEIVEGNVETAEEFVEADELEMEAEIASTATASATNNEVKTIDAATAAASADGVTVQFGTTATAAATVQTETVKTLKDVNAKYLGTASGNRKAITLVGDSTFRDINKLQAVIDANNIVCYPTADMTQGVKYFAGHNPGAMSHVAGLKVGSIVRLSNDEGYQDYQIREIKQGAGSFASITFNTTKGVMDAWTMLRTGSENAVIVQYCIDGVNTLHYGVAI